MNRATAIKVVDALHGLALANWADFSENPELVRVYQRNLRSKNCKYVDDKLTCGKLDCWSTYRDLVERYPGGPILGDCEDFATAHAAYLAYNCFQGVYVGLVVGKRVSHAIAGASKNGTIQIIDPSRWFGMGETHYRNPLWRKLA